MPYEKASPGLVGHDPWIDLLSFFLAVFCREQSLFFPVPAAAMKTLCEETGVTSWILSCPVWVMLSALEMYGGFPTLHMTMEEVIIVQVVD